MQLSEVRVAPFDIQGAEIRDRSLRGRASIFPSIHSLQSLMLTFESTKFSAEGDPWGYLGPYNGHEWYCDFRGNRDREGFYTSCQKLIMDWTLTFAKPYIAVLPKVILSGYIKHSTKQK